MTDKEFTNRIDRLEAKIDAMIIANASPFLRGDAQAAQFANFRSRQGFTAWAKSKGIRPSLSGVLKFWSKADILRARNHTP